MGTQASTRIFVACSSKVGSVKLVGPVTGESYIINSKGVPIDLRDSDLLDEEIDVFCFRRGCFIKQKAIFEISPSISQIRLYGG